MIKKKRLREKGKTRLSEYYKELKEGERVAVVLDLAENPKFPKRMQGKTGVIEGKRGKSYKVRINDYKQPKTYIIKPIHLRRIKVTK